MDIKVPEIEDSGAEIFHSAEDIEMERELKRLLSENEGTGFVLRVLDS